MANAPKASGDERMYPANRLTEQVRDPKDTFSVFQLLKDTFFKNP